MNSPTTAICVLGMHRSGTSCLAGSLHAAGLYLDEAQESKTDNLKGNWEHRSINELNDAVLAENHAAWDNPPGAITWSRQHQRRRDAIIAELAAESQAWLFKDPRTLLTLPFWQEGVSDLRFIGSFRDPLRVAISLYLRDLLPLPEGLRLWIHYNRILLDAWTESPFPLICFDLPAESYRAQLAKLIDRLSTSLSGQLPLSSSAAQEFYESALAHPDSFVPLPRVLPRFHGRLS